MNDKRRTSNRWRSSASLTRKLKKLKPTLGRRFKVKTIGVFGSQVRGQAHRFSDVDVLVEFSRRIDLLDFVALEKYLTEQTGAKIDLVSAKALRPEFRSTVLNEVVYI